MNIEQIRKDIPGYGNKLYFNSAGASLMPQSVVRKIEQHLHTEEEVGGYKAAEIKEEEIADFYMQTARLLGCKTHNIAFAHDATDAYTKALSSIHFQQGDVLITTDDDYTSNQIQFISLQKRYGIRIKRIKTLENGDLDIAHFEELVNKHKPKLVAVTHVPTNSGLIQNVEAIGQICSERQILYIVDACQSVGQLAIDVQKIKCDFLSATGRKFLRGPRGTGFLYVSDRVLSENYAPLFIDGGGATWTRTDQYEMLPTAKRFQTWEAPYALILGFSEALRYAHALGIHNIQSYNQQLMQQLRENLSQVPAIDVFDKGSHSCNILTFRKKGKSLEQIKAHLEREQVYFSVSQKQWGLIDFGKKGIDWAIRLSPHYFNTMEEIDQLTTILDEI